MRRIIGNILFKHISYLTYTSHNTFLLRQRRQKGGGNLMYFGIAFPNELVLLRVSWTAQR